MQDANYEEVLRRRQERRRRERLRRRRQVMMIYLLIFAVVLSGAVIAFGYWRNRQTPGTGGASEVVNPTAQPEPDHSGEDLFDPENPSSSEPEDGQPSGQEGEASTGPEGEALTGPEEEVSTGSDEEASTGSDGEVSTNTDAVPEPDAASGEDTEDENGAEPVKQSWIKRFFAWMKRLFTPKEKGISPAQGTADAPDAGVSGGGSGEGGIPEGEPGGEAQPASLQETQVQPEDQLVTLLTQADRLAAGYDYDAAIALLQSAAEFSGRLEVAQAIQTYEAAKTTLVEYDIRKVTHVFFHSLVMDNAKAFDGDSDAQGYNEVMTTRSEFLKILQEMYNRGYVLVRLHDMAHEETDENGNVKMVKGKILLPEGKKAFVMSQDDVCYYPYMDDDGFARRVIIGEDGKPVCEMVMDDGTVAVGAYDLIPLLEEFIQEHPDFSYRGARAVIAFTGYEGILGYRTAASYRDTNPNYEADCQQAALVAQCLRDNGWELASHSWGHRQLGQIDEEHFQNDTNKWEAEVESLIGPTDIILYPFGDDIGDWYPYTTENPRFTYLYNVGFRYFCNVDSAQYWVQLGDTFLRQGRRNLDGYRMWQDIAAGQEGRTEDRKLDDLFRAEDVFDPDRPTPVVWE